MSTPVDDELSATFAALANGTRRQILDRLATEGSATVNELAAPFDVSLPTISQHLKVLERAGLIERGRTKQFRPCTINAKRLREVSQWVEHYRHVWDERFDRMDEQLERLQQPQHETGTHHD